MKAVRAKFKFTIAVDGIWSDRYNYSIPRGREGAKGKPVYSIILILTTERATSKHNSERKPKRF